MRAYLLFSHIPRLLSLPNYHGISLIWSAITFDIWELTWAWITRGLPRAWGESAGRNYDQGLRFLSFCILLQVWIRAALGDRVVGMAHRLSVCTDYASPKTPSSLCAAVLLGIPVPTPTAPKSPNFRVCMSSRNFWEFGSLKDFGMCCARGQSNLAMRGFSFLGLSLKSNCVNTRTLICTRFK